MVLWRNWKLACVIAALPLVLVACGGGGGADGAAKTGGAAAAGGATTLTVSGNEFAFRPAELRVKANQDVTVQLSNTGQVLHDFSTRGQARDVKIDAQPGQRGSGTFKAAARPGRYDFVCAQPGHEQAGMKGVLIVE